MHKNSVVRDNIIFLCINMYVFEQKLKRRTRGYPNNSPNLAAPSPNAPRDEITRSGEPLTPIWGWQQACQTECLALWPPQTDSKKSMKIFTRLLDQSDASSNQSEVLLDGVEGF